MPSDFGSASSPTMDSISQSFQVNITKENLPPLPSISNNTNRSNFNQRLLNRSTNRTPRSQIINPNAARRNGPREFTPMLQSAYRPSNLGLKDNTNISTASRNGSPNSLLKSKKANTSSTSQDAYSSVSSASVEEFSEISTPKYNLDSSRNLSDSIPNKDALSLKDQELLIDKIKKENFALKLKIYFLSESMKGKAPENVQTTLDENAEMKAQLCQKKNELIQYKKILSETQTKFESIKEQIISQDNQFSQEQKEKLEKVLVLNKEKDQNLNQAQEEIQTLKKELDDLKDVIAEDEINSLKENINDIMGEKDDLERELRNKDLFIDELRTKISQLEKENTSNNNDSNLSEQIESLNLSLKEKDDQIQQLQDDLDFLTDDIQSEKELNQKLKQKLDDLKLDNKDNNQNIEKTKQLELEISHYKDKVRILETNLSDIEDKLAKSESQRSKIDFDLNTQKNLNKQKSDSISSLEQEIIDLQSKISNYELELQKARNEVLHDNEKSMTNINFIEQTHLREIDNLKDLLSKTNQALYESQNDYKNAISQLEDAKKNSDSLHSRLTNLLNNDSKQSNALENVLQSTIDQLKNEKENNQKEISELRNKVDNLTRENNKLNDNYVSLEQDLLRNEADYLDIKTEMNETINNDRQYRDKLQLLSSQNQKLSMTNKVLEDKNTYFSSEIDRITSEHKASLQEVSVLKQKISSYERQISNLESDKKRIEALLNISQEENSSRKKDLSRLNDEILQLKKEKIEKSASENESKSPTDSFYNNKYQQDKINEKQKEIDELKLKSNSFEDSNKQLKLEILSLNEEIKALNRLSNMHTEELQIKEQQLTDLRTKIAEYSKKNIESHSAKEKIFHLNKEIQKLMQHSDEIKIKLNNAETTIKTLKENSYNQSQVISDDMLQMNKERKLHFAEMRGMEMLIKHLKNKTIREKRKRQDLIFAKSFCILQINKYKDSNRESLALLREYGIKPDKKPTRKEPSKLKAIGIIIMFLVRIKRLKLESDGANELKAAITQEIQKRN